MLIKRLRFTIFCQKTVEERVSKTIWVKCVGREKERVSVMLLGASDGSKKPPFVVFKQVKSLNNEKYEINISERNGFGQKIWVGLNSQ
jgi:hypothetical protein